MTSGEQEFLIPVSAGFWKLERVFTSYNFAYILHGSKMAE